MTGPKGDKGEPGLPGVGYPANFSEIRTPNTNRSEQGYKGDKGERV